MADYVKESIRPREGVQYHCYSLPAFDAGLKPERLDGSEIKSSKLLVHPGDILVNKLNMRYKRIWAVGEPEPNSVCSTEFVPLQAKGINRLFLYYVLAGDEFAHTLGGMRTGTSGSHQRVKPEWILDYGFYMPCDQDQAAIANILGSMDARIHINQRINDYLAALLDAQFDNLIKTKSADWDTASLLDIASYKNGLAMQRFRPVGDDVGLPVLKIRELGQGYCGCDAERCRSDIDESVTIHDGDLVFSWSGTLLLDFWAGGDAGLNQHLFKGYCQESCANCQQP
ncbi:hypothetical protein GMI70_10170 [Eggerthellaceae bacterium zg-893]|nr:hypothetical protein [Eggerthellaceae bacterium zg-893]